MPIHVHPSTFNSHTHTHTPFFRQSTRIPETGQVWASFAKFRNKMIIFPSPGLSLSHSQPHSGEQRRM